MSLADRRPADTGPPFTRPAEDRLPLVRADMATRTFGAGAQAVVAVHAASCSIRRGDRIAIMGPSGSGKSTLLYLLAGLDVPSSGVVTWPALSATADGLAGSIAMVFQEPSLMPALTAVENVAFPLLLAGVDDGLARHSAAAALEMLNIGELGDRLPEELSGGQAQRVCVARAVVNEPQLIVADEPTGQLDSAAATRVVEVLIEAADMLGAGLVIATHDPLVASHLSDRWQMHEGVLAGLSGGAVTGHARELT